LEDFRDRIDQLLIPKRWKKPQLAKEAGVNYSTIKTWYNRRESIPNAKDLYCVAKALGTSVEYLMTGEEKIAPNVLEDPVKKQLWDFIQSLDKDRLIELRGILKMFNYMTLQPQMEAKKENMG